MTRNYPKAEYPRGISEMDPSDAKRIKVINI